MNSFRNAMTVFLSCSVLLLTSTATSERAVLQEGQTQSVTPVALPPELARVLTDYEKGWKAGDVEALSNLFAEDGFVLTSGQPAVRGRAAIRHVYKGNGGPLSLRAFAYATNGDVGYIIGGYASEPGKTDTGKFTLTLRKIGNRWFIVSDMDNSNTRRNPQ